MSVPNIFLPDSEIQYWLNWRNVTHVDLALYPVDLARDVQMPAEGRSAGEWLSCIDLNGREKIKSWTYEPRSSKSAGAGLRPRLRHGGAELPASR